MAKRSAALLVLLGCCLGALPSTAQAAPQSVSMQASAKPDPKADKVRKESSQEPSQVEQEAQPDLPDLLGGSLSAHNQLLKDETPKRGFLRFRTALEPWEALKRRIKENIGLSIGGSYGLLYQRYSSSLVDKQDGFSHKFALNLSWDLVGRGTDGVGSLNIAIEDRRALGGNIAPLYGGLLAGSMVPTTATASDFGFGLTQFYWRQNLARNRFQYAIGRIFAPNYIDPYPLFDDNRQFFSQSFATSPTTAASLRGFGAVALGYVTNNVYLLGGVYNANSKDIGPTIKNFFQEREYFYQIEVGWTGQPRRPVSISHRGATDSDNVHLTFWHKAKQVEEEIPESSGVAFNANFMLRENLMWFLRAGWSDGEATLVDANISAGIGFRPRGTDADLFGVGVGWAHPSSVTEGLNPEAGDQYTFETFYRFQLTSNFAVSPNLQVIANPALDPDTDTLLVGGLRGRLAF